MAILIVKSPCTATVIAIGAQLLFVFVAGHGGCWHIFGIWNSRLLGYPLWKLVRGIIVWVPNRSSSVWPAVFLDMAHFAILATSHIWSGRLTSYIDTTISTVWCLEVNFIQSLVEKILNGHSLWSILKDEFMKYPHKRKFCTLGAQYWRPRHSQVTQHLPRLVYSNL